MIEYKVKVNNNGDQYWYLNGKCHREDGPAIIHTNGSKSWYLNGKYFKNEDEWRKALNPVKEMTVAEISEALGYEVKVIK